MSDAVKAVQAYSPRIIKGVTVQIDELVTFIAGRTGLNKSTIVAVLMEVQEGILSFNKTGRSVKVAELGIFSPGIDKKGNLRVNFRAVKNLNRKLNRTAHVPFLGKIKNKDMLGKSKQDYIERWNQEHPEDPVE